MKTNLKPCKICGKAMPKGLNNVCSPKCAKEKEKLKNRAIKEKKKARIPALSKLADLLWAKYIRLNAGKCEYCGDTKNLNAHHIFTRHSRNTRWEENNGICLCRKHHTFSDEFSRHKTPVEFTYWLEAERGKEFINELRAKANQPLKVTAEYLQEKIAYYKEKIKELEKYNN